MFNNDFNVCTTESYHQIIIKQHIEITLVIIFIIFIFPFSCACSSYEFFNIVSPTKYPPTWAAGDHKIISGFNTIEVYFIHLELFIASVIPVLI